MSPAGRRTKTMMGSYRINPNIRIMLMVLLMSVTSVLHGQNTDSLKRVLFNALPDTNKANTLNELCRAYRTNSPDSAIAYGQASRTLSETLNYRKGIATALNYIGAIYFFKGDYKMARLFQNQSLQEATRSDLPAQLANTWNSLALIDGYESNFAGAMASFLKALKMEERLENKKGIIKVLGNMAQLYKVMGDDDHSLLYSFKALALTETMTGVDKSRASVSNNIGLIYVKKKKYEEALCYLQINLAIGRKLNDRWMVVNALNNLGHCYLNSTTDPAFAEPFIEEAYRLLHGVSSEEMRSIVLLNIGALRTAQHRPAEAMRLLNESVSIAKSANSKEQILLCYLALAEANRQLHNDHYAYTYTQQAYLLNDSLRNAEIFDKISNIQKGHEIISKQAQIDNLSSEAHIRQLESAKQRNLIFFLFIALVLVALLAAWIYFSLYTKAKLNRMLANRNSEIQRLNLVLEIKALRSQMDPHFVFNALNGLQHFLVTQNTEASVTYLTKVARFIRLTLQNAAADWIKISEEVELLKLYLEVEQYRFPGKFDFEFKIDPFTKNERIPFLVIQPYVENAVLHGLVPRKSQGGKLLISITREAGQLVISVEDNGVGRKAAVEKADPMFKSMGSGLVRDRLQKLSRQLDAFLREQIEDLVDEYGTPLGTRSILVFENASPINK